MFKCRIKQTETLFQMSQPTAIIPQLPLVPERRTYGQIHFDFLSIKSTNIIMPLPLSLTCGISICSWISASGYGMLFIIVYCIITYIILCYTTLHYISIEILRFLAIYSFSYKFQVLTERRWLTIKPKHAEKHNL